MHDGDETDLRARRGGLTRLWATGRIAASATRLALRRVVGREGDEDGLIGERLARELDQMKGAAMKVGQILSYFDGVLPEATHQALRHLQRGGRSLPAAEVAELIERAFERSIGQLFERFDARPVAAASIGQVHRARWEGREVAVKVQYPGVRETMVADVSRLRALSQLASLATKVDGPSLVDELAERFALECDYGLEAANQNAFRAAFARESWAYVPEAYLERTRLTVLTSEWMEGRDFYELAERAPQAERNRVGLSIARFTLRCLFAAGVINADPHPGNYLFPGDGRVVFLDFGCVRRFSPEFLAAQRRLVRVVVEGRRAEFPSALIASGMVGDAERFDYDNHWRMMCQQLAPFRAPTFRFSSQHLKETLELSKASNPNLRRIAIPPQWIWLQRLMFGMQAVLARLGADGPFADELRDALDGSSAANAWTIDGPG